MTTLTTHPVLVVDDNADAAQSLAMALELLEQKVHVAYTGRAALDVIDALDPDLIILDLSMPGMDGFELARAIRGRPRFTNTRMVALTGLCQDEARAQSKAAGFDEHLLKPIEFEDLIRLVRELD